MTPAAVPALVLEVTEAATRVWSAWFRVGPAEARRAILELAAGRPIRWPAGREAGEVRARSRTTQLDVELRLEHEPPRLVITFIRIREYR